MTRGQFEQAFDGLPKRRREVLQLFLAGMEDEEIARTLHIKEGTVRSHIRNSCDAFGLENEFPDDRTSRRGDLIELFKQYKPELVKEKEEEEERSQFDPNFVGREEAIADLNVLIENGAKCIQILSAGGQGKTTLAWKFLKTRFADKDILYFPIGKETKDIASIESLVEERLRQLREEPGREFMVSLGRLRERLTRQPMGVLIDNLEPALDKSNRFVEQHRSYVELFKQVLLSPEVRAVTLITSRAPLQEGLAIQKYTLKPLSVEAWNQYFQHRKIVTDPTILQEVHGTYNGNALAMEILCSAIQDEEDYQNNLTAYWIDNKTEDGVYIEDPVLNLISEQFNSLEQLKPDAYKLLCRMGCFRYQDVPTVPEEGLFCLLWDVDKSQHKRVVKILKNRALVDVVDGNYRLHPVIRAEALEHLRASKDWENTNQVAAKFWTESIQEIKTVTDTIQALEAYFHYYAINQFGQCAFILTQHKEHKIAGQSNKQYSWTLGSSLYLFGIYEKTINIILDLVKHNLEDREKMELCKILGHLLSPKGNIRVAIEQNKISRKIARTLGNKKYEMYANIDIALRLLDLRDLNESKNYLFRALPLSQHNELLNYLPFVKIHLYLIDLMLTSNIKKNNIDADLKEIDFSKLSPWNNAWCLSVLGETYQNLRQYDKAIIVLRKSKNIARINEYRQIEGKCLTRIAMVDSIKSDFSNALSNHTKSIQILDEIDAKCDLAEAHYQFALTYQAMNNSESQTHFNKALELWTEIDAPKQIERVQNSMNNASC